MINDIKRNIYQRSIFQELNKHCSGQQLFNTHKDQVIALIITQYLNLRFHHAASIKEKRNVYQWGKNTVIHIYNSIF